MNLIHRPSTELPTYLDALKIKRGMSMEMVGIVLFLFPLEEMFGVRCGEQKILGQSNYCHP